MLSEKLTALTPVQREVAERFLASSAIRKSARLRKLFTYLIEHSASGHPHEQEIGTNVFGRQSGYDTAADNIVRVNMFLLRQKLELYFSAEGAAEPEVITVPKGRYALEFQPRGHAVGEQPPQVPVRLRRRRRVAVLAAVPLIAGVVLSWAWLKPQPAAGLPDSPQHWRLWRTLFSPDQDAYIVVADIGLSLLQDLSGVTIGLDRYLNRIDPDLFKGARALPPQLVERLSGRQYTAVSNASIVFRLGAINGALGGRTVVRAAQAIDIRDLKTHPVVLLGSERSNPWVSLIGERMKLRIQYEGSPPKGFVRNLTPGNGVPDVLKATAFGASPGEALGVIAYLPNLEGAGHIVSIAGTNMEGTEAAAEMLLNERKFAELARELRLDIGRAIPHFEAVISAASIGGAGSNPKVVLARRLD